MRFYKFLLLALFALPAAADTVTFNPQAPSEPGWNFLMGFGVDNPNFSFARFVPGIDDGTLVHLGGSARFRLTYLAGQHEWRNRIGLAVGYNLDQFVSDFVKTRDYLKFRSTYYFSISEIWGLFGHFKLDTSMFPGLDIQPEDSPTIYTVLNPDLTVNTTTPAQTRLTLTGAFSPLVLNENVGLFLRPLAMDWLSFEGKLGVYFNQGFVDGKRIIIDVDDGAGPNDPTTTTALILENYYQIGAGLDSDIWGVIAGDFSYNASLDVFYAFYDKASVRDLPSSFANNISMDAGIGLNYQPISWLGFSWEGRARWQPYIIDQFQFDSFFNLNFTLSM